MIKELGERASELQKHQDNESELQNELRMLREERKRTENETLRNQTVQIKQLEAKARLEYAEIVKEQRMRQEKEINQLKETTRLEKEEHERQWERKKNDMNLKLTNSRKEQSWSPRRWKSSGKITNS